MSDATSIARAACCALASWLALAAGEAGALLIDDFSTAHAVAAFDPQTTGSGQASGAGILGSERDLFVTRTEGFGATIGASGGRLVVDHVVGGVGTESAVWDGVDGSAGLDATGLGGIDFTESGLSNAFALDILVADVALTLTFTVYSSALDFSEASVVVPGGIPPGAPYTLELEFADFTVAGGAGADFNSVGALELFVDAGRSPVLSLEVDDLRTLLTPEPTTASLVLAGVVALAGAHRRHRRDSRSTTAR